MPVVYHQKDAKYRVFLDSRQGGRKYMEDVVAVREHISEDGQNDFVFFAVYDGHGGYHAAKFAREHLLDEIKKQRGFWTDDQEQITRAIKEAFVSTHRLMWKCVGSWPKTVSGLPSTSGTTASIVIIKNGKMYVAHVGDSSVVIGEEDDYWGRCIANCPTVDHKPEDPLERKRIEAGGGRVMSKSGVQRVVWHRPRPNHQGPVRRSTHIDDIPFLAVARALGDLWSYNSQRDTFVVSPEPDITVYDFDIKKHKYIIVASDGLWNMVKPEEAVEVVQDMDDETPYFNLANNPARALVQLALDKWSYRHMRADNTSVVLAMIEAPDSEEPLKSRLSSRESSVSTVKLSDTETERIADSDLEIAAHVELTPNGIERPSGHSKGTNPWAASSHRLLTAKHIHALSGKTPRNHSYKHNKPPMSAPPKVIHSRKSSLNSVDLTHSPRTPITGTPSYLKSTPLLTASNSYNLNIGATASPMLTGIKRKIKPTDDGLSPLQTRHITAASPAAKRKSSLSFDSCASATKRKCSLSIDSFASASKKPRRNSVSGPRLSISPHKSNSESSLPDPVAKGLFNHKSKDDSVLANGFSLVSEARLSMPKADSPKIGTSPCSPLKVDTCHEDSPSMAVVSPIWPTCLERDIEIETHPEDPYTAGTFSLPVSRLARGKIHQKCSRSKPDGYRKSKSRSRSHSLSKKIVSAHSKYSSLKSKSQSQVATRITVKRLQLRSKRPLSLRNSLHLTRFQVNSTAAR